MQDIILFDLDGTLALIEHRQHYVRGKKKRWRDFFAACIDDTPNAPLITLLHVLYRQFQIYIVSGRSDEVRAQTEDWLLRHQVPYHRLIMRKEGDYTPDNVLKRSWVEDGTLPKNRILCVFDDRDKVVKMWREMGLPCYQVAEGNF
jgi:hypothetical protein